MVNLDFEDKFRKTILKMEEVGNAYAEAKGQSWQQQELKYAVLSSIIKNLGDLPANKAELLAKGSDDYKSYLAETAKAITKELRLKAEYEKWKSSCEALRSLSSLEKATQNQISH